MNRPNGKMDDQLKQLMTVIVMFGLTAQLSGMFFVESMLRYTIGLWTGIVLSLACAYHMWWSLDRNLTINAGNESAARTFAIKHNLIRYGVIVVVFAAICLTDVAYPLAAFLGIMSLKISAYIQPLINRRR